MEARNPELPPRPPGAVNALVRGFNALTGNISVIFFPVALDVFLWLGPRLKMERIFTSTFEQMLKLQGSDPALFPSTLPTATPADIHTALQGFNPRRRRTMRITPLQRIKPTRQYSAWFTGLRC